MAMGHEYFLAPRIHNNFNFEKKNLKILLSLYFLSFYMRKISTISFCSSFAPKLLKGSITSASTKGFMDSSNLGVCVSMVAYPFLHLNE